MSRRYRKDERGITKCCETLGRTIGLMSETKKSKVSSLIGADAPLEVQ